MAGVTNTEMCDVRQREAHCVRNQFFVIREVSGGDWATQAGSGSRLPCSIRMFI